MKPGATTSWRQDAACAEHARLTYNARMGETIGIAVNGEPRQIAAGSSIAMLLAEHDLHPQRVAVEVNERLVRRADFVSAVLRPQDRVEIVTLVGGG